MLRVGLPLLLAHGLALPPPVGSAKPGGARGEAAAGAAAGAGGAPNATVERVPRCLGGTFARGECHCPWPRELVSTPAGQGCGYADCGHGSWDWGAAACLCREGFRHAGVTNPLNLLRSRCTQFECESDSGCAELLGIEGALCPVKGWNCDCGLWHSFFGKADSPCMYPWWALASKATRLLEFLTLHLWQWVSLVALLLLPFGKNVVGTADAYSLMALGHDLAWSMFALKLGAWVYLFSVATYVSLAVAWIGAVVVVVAATLVCICVVGTVAACVAAGGEGGGLGGAELHCCADCGGCAECGGCPGCAECAGCADCCAGSAAGQTPASLYLYDPLCCYAGPAGPRECEGCCRCCSGAQGRLSWVPCCRVLAGLFPRVPENMLGGALGFAVGTHPLRNTYDEGSRAFRLLSHPCWSLSNRSEGWRQEVFRWLHERDAAEAAGLAGVAVAEAQREAGSPHVRYGDVCVECKEGLFTASDRIFNLGDYEANCCWICQDSASSWDMWASCRHAFCERCSNEMLRRRMPCPMCRVRSSRVVRRRAQAHGPADESQQLLEGPGAAQKSAVPRRAGGRGPAPQQVPPAQVALEVGDGRVR